MDADSSQLQPTPEFAAIRTWSLFWITIVAVLLPSMSFSRVWPRTFWRGEIFLRDAVVEVSCYLFLAFLLQRLCAEAGRTGWSVFGRIPTGRELFTLIGLAAPLAGISWAGLYALFLPISWAFPELVKSWVLDDTEIVRWTGSVGDLTGSLLNSATLVVLAPIVEEILFRGFLLNRWWMKYGLRKAIAMTSLLFGLMHVNVIGGLIFGIVASMIYVRTRSLAGPIIVHMSNNALVGILLMGEGNGAAELPETSLAEFQSYWWTAPLAAAIAIPWLVWFHRKYLKTDRSEEIQP